MKIILLSGGSGTRLWPLSNDSRAKQFLRVLRNQETNKLESMLERVYQQLIKLVSASDIIIASNKLQVDMIRNQLGDVQIVTEPERRDTFAAIALACSNIYSNKEMDENEIITVVSVDTYVESSFYEKVMDLKQLIIETNAKLGLIGIKPTYPSSKYGYLVPKYNGYYMEVGKFIEKPSEIDAMRLMGDGAYWNSGVFAFRLNLIFEKLKRLNLNCDIKSLYMDFDKLPNKSFDYEMVEEIDSIVALTYDGYWKDLGTWNTLTEEMSQNVIGNGGLSEDCTNTHIVNELHLPVKVLGISNAVIAVSSDGILVTDKPSSSRMKDMLQEGLFSIPMYEERAWGSYRVLDFTKIDGTEVLTKRVNVKAGQYTGCHYHNTRKEVWTIVSGKALAVIDDVIQIVGPGNTIEISVGLKHGIYTIQDTELIEVQIAPFIAEEDTIDWEGSFGIVDFSSYIG